jgi:GNAT superfamily N-acetyltransferase
MGAVDVDGAELGAFVLAVPGEDEARGRHVWIELELAAVHHEAEPNVLRRLYAGLAAGWVRAGVVHHYAVVRPADAPTWLALAFAHEQVYGVHRAVDQEPGPEGGVRLRLATAADLDAIAPLAGLISEAHAASPVFAYIEPAFRDNQRPGTLALLEDPTCAYWIAEDDAGVAAYAAMRPVPAAEASMLKPAGAAELVVAATAPRARGRGIGVALTRRAIAWAAAQGPELCITDWRAANLTSSTFWPHRGFRPAAYRLHRMIDPRVVPR